MQALLSSSSHPFPPGQLLPSAQPRGQGPHSQPWQSRPCPRPCPGRLQAEQDVETGCAVRVTVEEGACWATSCLGRSSWGRGPADSGVGGVRRVAQRSRSTWERAAGPQLARVPRQEARCLPVPQGPGPANQQPLQGAGATKATERGTHRHGVLAQVPREAARAVVDGEGGAVLHVGAGLPAVVLVVDPCATRAVSLPPAVASDPRPHTGQAAPWAPARAPRHGRSQPASCPIPAATGPAHEK